MKDRRMHPPRFLPDHHRLLDWPDCFLEITCCKGTSLWPVRLLAKRGNPTFRETLARLRCKAGGGRPRGPVYLCAGQVRAFSGGGPPDWSIQIAPGPRARDPG